jgi:hypothetical protein
MTAKKKVAGQGRKQCPKCDAIIGARAMVCECGHKFTPKAKPLSSSSSLEKSVEIVRVIGGVKALKAALEAYAKTAKPIDQLGGYEKAKEVLGQLEAIKAL